MPTLSVFTKQYRSPESLILDLACLCPMVDFFKSLDKIIFFKQFGFP